MAIGGFSKQATMGALPSGWQSYTVGQTLTLINGLAFKPSDWKTHGTPIVRIQNLNDEDSPYNYCDSPVSEKYRIRAGDILFAWSGTTGTSFGARIWAGPNAVLNQHIFKVVPDKTKLTPYYSFLVLQNVQGEIERRAHGFKSSFVHVKKSDLVSVPLPIPPISEQRAIVEVFSETDQLIANLGRLVEKKQAIKQGMMRQLLTGACRLPGFNGKWREAPFVDVSSMKGRIGWQGLTQDEFISDARQPFLITGMNFKDGAINWSEVYHVSEDRYAVAPEIQLRPDDVLMTKDGTIGKLLYVDAIPSPGKATLNSHLLVFRPRDGAYMPRFLYYQLASPRFTEHIELHKSGTTFFGISQESVGKYRVLLPPVTEQRAIAAALADADAEIGALQVRLAKSRAVKQGMMQELLTGRTRLPSKVAAT